MRSLRRVRPILAALAAVPVLSGCDLPRFGYPKPASDQAESLLELWQGFFVAALGVGALVWGLIIYAIVRFRRNRDDDGDQVPSQKQYNIPVEVVYTVAPILAVAALFSFSVATENDVNSLSDDPAVKVDVTGFQWSWQFDYPDENISVTGEPGEPPELVLPVGQTAQLNLVSTDVDHAFWVPEFLSKRDLIPGVDNTIDVTPNKTGSYTGRCAEFCGLDHWQMYYTVRVVPEDEYDDWLDEQERRS